MLKYKTKQDQEELGTQSIVEGSKFVSQEAAVLLKGNILRC
jgi:DNA mismatch repair protein MutL